MLMCVYRHYSKGSERHAEKRRRKEGKEREGKSGRSVERSSDGSSSPSAQWNTQQTADALLPEAEPPPSPPFSITNL